MKNLQEALNWRYAVKKFDATKKIPAADWSQLEEALRLTASSYGLQPWKFLVVQNKDILKKLTPLSWNQTQVEDSSHFVVLTYKKKMDEDHINKFIQKTAQVRGVEASTMDGYKGMMIGDLVKGPRAAHIDTWAKQQVYIAMGQVLTAAALLSVDTCPMEGLDPAGYDKVLNLEGSGYNTVAAIAFGYRHADDKYQHAKKVRFDKADVIINI
ncbi:MAG: NAD(P)H-dependent oxidoreductase [Pseudobdellovibrionaceae bacterium]